MVSVMISSSVLELRALGLLFFFGRILEGASRLTISRKAKTTAQTAPSCTGTHYRRRPKFPSLSNLFACIWSYLKQSCQTSFSPRLSE